MKPVLIVENSTSSLIRESASTNKEYVLGGTFTEFGVKNRNERIYQAEKFLPALQEMNERMSSLGVVYGEFDHPDVFDTSLSRASHIITKAEFVAEKNIVAGEIKLLSTYWGKEAKSLVDDGCPVFVSSRAAGITESDGSVSLKKLFTYDIVADPGFASAKMSVKVLNESLGFCPEGQIEKNNFRIYELSDESKINELFNMNKDEFVTKKQLSDYSQYLVKEIASTKSEVKSAISKGNMSPQKLEQLLEYYEELNNTNSQVAKYLDYLADKIQVVVNENKSLKDTTEKLAKHNDYLAENLEKAIAYSEYVAENLDKNIEYSEYLAENLDKNINYSEYIAENLDKNISYSEYLAENLDKNIEYSEYLAENLDKNIAYSEYIAENLDKNIAYSEYIAESVDNSIAYSEYLAEHVEGNIAYSEYIAEHLDDNIAYSEYVAESLDKSISYQGMIVERLNGGFKLNESTEEEGEAQFPTLQDAGFEENEEELEEEGQEELEGEGQEEGQEEFTGHEGHEDFAEEAKEFAEEAKEFAEDAAEFAGHEGHEEGEEHEGEEHEEELEGEGQEESQFMGEEDSELSESINKLIEEAKKRKVSESSDLNFLKFLNKSQVDSFYALSDEEQDNVKLHINESSYFTQKEVLTLIAESLSTKNESLEERVIRLMPENIKPIWGQLNESAKKSILSQARLYPEDVLKTENQIEHFWGTRNIKKNESTTKKLVAHEALIQEDKLSDNEMTAIMERFKSI
jgi:hypothetical protein